MKEKIIITVCIVFCILGIAIFIAVDVVEAINLPTWVALGFMVSSSLLSQWYWRIVRRKKEEQK